MNSLAKLTSLIEKIENTPKEDYEKLYNQIKKDISSGYLDFNLISEACYKIAIRMLNDIFEYFDKISFAYYDVHAENIMFKSGDIKLVDLDSGIFKSIDSERYQQDVVKSNNNLASLYLEIMLGYIEEFSISYMLTNNQINKLLSQSTSKQLEFLLNAVVGTSSVIDLPSYIDSFDELTVLRMKRIVFGE